MFFSKRKAIINEKKKINLSNDTSAELVNLNNTNDQLDSNTINTNNLTYSNRPQNTAASQQRLPAWKPLLTPKFVVLLFITSALVFIPLGVLLYLTSNNIYEFQHDYTDCIDLNTINKTKQETCHNQLLKNFSYHCKCRVKFNEDRFQNEPMLIYYMLETYFQNQRRYVKSRDYDQLLGRTDHPLSYDCEPYRYHYTSDGQRVKYAPCGAVANSFFNDTFQLYYVHSNEPVKINISKADIAWYSDKTYKFRNPKDFSNIIKPPNWRYNITEFDSGYVNEDLIVWMRTAAFPTFRKLYGRILMKENVRLWQLYTNHSIQNIIQNIINNSSYFSNKYPLPKGHYFLDIDYRYMVKQFGGKKMFILANTSWIGGKCYFLAISYLVFGSLCFATAVFLHVLHYLHGRMSYDASLELLEDTNSSN